MSQAYFADPTRHFPAFRLDGAVQHDPATSISVAYNGWIDVVTATLPPPLPGKAWYQVADTSAAALSFGGIHAAGAQLRLSGC